MKKRKILSALMACILLFSVAACSKSTSEDEPITTAQADLTEKETSQTTQPETTVSESQNVKKDNETILKDYFTANSKSGKCAYTLFDFDKDGQKDMLLTKQSFVGQTDITEQYDLILVKTKDNAAYIADTFSISDKEFEDYAVFLSSDAEYYKSDTDYPQYVETYINSNGYIACNCFTRLNSWGVHYFVIEVKNDKFSVKQHLLDPGGTSGNGVYYYDAYPEDSLYGFEVPDYHGGKYKSYKAALDNEIGIYGFEYEPFDHQDTNDVWEIIGEKYCVKKTASVINVYSYKNKYLENK